ncbi:hypothetical protein [Halobaculum sp. EA56]|uniref:hypothetical protein n=1 Tax=Halobaculum sp. EA56 TaxID=3421648 RepID=UPI003EBE0B77
MGFGTKSVYLGSDTTISQMKYGDKYTEINGTLAEPNASADFSTSENDIYTGVGCAGGAGTCTAWAYLGRAIQVEDSSGEELATFTARGYLQGSMEYNEGAIFEQVELIVEDETDNERYDETIFKKSDYNDAGIQYSYNDSLLVELEAGHTYGVHIKSTSELSHSYDIGAASVVDFNPPTNNGYVSVDEVDISF